MLSDPLGLMGKGEGGKDLDVSAANRASIARCTSPAQADQDLARAEQKAQEELKRSRELQTRSMQRALRGAASAGTSAPAPAPKLTAPKSPASHSAGSASRSSARITGSAAVSPLSYGSASAASRSGSAALRVGARDFAGAAAVFVEVAGRLDGLQSPKATAAALAADAAADACLAAAPASARFVAQRPARGGDALALTCRDDLAARNRLRRSRLRLGGSRLGPRDAALELARRGDHGDALDAAQPLSLIHI